MLFTAIRENLKICLRKSFLYFVQCLQCHFISINVNLTIIYAYYAIVYAYYAIVYAYYVFVYDSFYIYVHLAPERTI